MFLKDTLFETYSAIVANKARTSLTILGIVIGICSVIVMVAIGNGAKEQIENNIQSIGSNLLMIRPGAHKSPGSFIRGGMGSAQTLVMTDAQAIETEISEIELVAPISSGEYQVIAEGNNTRTSITGVTENYALVRNVEMETGSFVTLQQQNRLTKVAVIGPDVKDALFESDDDVLGKKIRINGIDFTIIGVTAAKGGTGFTSSDDIIYVPLSTYQQYFQGNEYLSMINVKVANQNSMTSVEDEIENLLLERHNLIDVDDADFNIMNQGDIVETASSVTDTLTILLGAVAGISLVVGGIGIMNMMLTSVTERTREIGLRKAIGAKSRDIGWQFLFESVALTFAGGIIGIVLGIVVSWMVENFFGTKTMVSEFSIILSFAVSAVIGMVFGYYPARRASRLNPIEALRYE